MFHKHTGGSSLNKTGRNGSPPVAHCLLLSGPSQVFPEKHICGRPTLFSRNLTPYCSVKELTETKLNRYYTTNSCDFSEYQFLANILLIAFIRVLSYYK